MNTVLTDIAFTNIVLMDKVSLSLHWAGLFTLGTIALVLAGTTYAAQKKKEKGEAVYLIFLFLFLSVFGWACVTAALYVLVMAVFPTIELSVWLPVLAFAAILYSIAGIWSFNGN